MPQLRPFQVEDVKRIVTCDMHALLASEQGTGKTVIAIKALEHTPGSFPAVVVCTVSLSKNWSREFQTWAPSVHCHLVTGENEAYPPLNGRTVLLVPWNLLHAHQERLAKAGIKTVIADECHLAKNPDSLRGRALGRLKESVDRVMLMTGTPVVNVKSDLAVLRKYTKRRPLLVRRFLEEAAPDVPPKKRAYIHVQMRQTARREYDQAVEDFEEWYRDHCSLLEEEGQGTVQAHQALATEALAKIGHLRRLVGQAKVPAAIDWISQAVRLGEPVVVFLEHQTVLGRITKGLRQQRIRYVVLEGDSSSDQRDQAVQRFQNHEVPVFIGTRAAKEGITLHAARHLLFVERYWTSADEEQAEDRIRRIGQKHKTHIWFLHVLGTIDDRIDEIVKAKRKLTKAEVGSIDIGESSQSNVLALLASWSKQAQPHPGRSRGLGLGQPQPPLPSPSITHALVFSPPRWKPSTIPTWCKMHGYEGKPDVLDPLRMIIHPATSFRQGTFSRVRIAKDVTAVVGTRIKRA